MDVDQQSNSEVSKPMATVRLDRTIAFLRTVPFTALFTLVFLVIGAFTGSMFTPASEKPWYEFVATGLPAFEQGRWWTVFTSPFVASPPLAYLSVLVLVVVGFGWAERSFGTWRTVAIALSGHLVGVLGSAAIVAIVARTGWHWAEMLSQTYDVGPSCAAFAALVFAIATLPSPWRLRARAAVVVWVGVSLLYLGNLYDLEHAVALVVALIATGVIPSLRHKMSRPSHRERRLIALWGLIIIGVIQVIAMIVPYDGPLGQHSASSSFWDVLLDLVVIALIANGIRRGHRFAWIVALVLGAYNVLTAALSFLSIPALIDDGYIDQPQDILGQFVAPAFFWLALMVFLIAGRDAFRVPLRKAKRQLQAKEISRADMVDQLHGLGGGTISWMTSWPDNLRIEVEDGALAYQVHSGVAIQLGDAVVSAGRHANALSEFVTKAEEAGFVPCVFSAGAATDQAKPEGWRSIVVAEDTIVDLPGLAFTGKAWNHVRTAINRAGREGIEFRMLHLNEAPWSLLAQVRMISEQWTGDKGLPEMGFTLGTVDEALDPEVLVGVALDQEGNLHGVTSWLPVYSTTEPGRIAGWTLDLMRRRDEGFPPVMEFLIASSAKHFSEAGYDFLSLSGAPLVRGSEQDDEAIYRVLDQLSSLAEPLYGFKSLHRFKQKFNPRDEELYLLYRDEGDLPRIGIAILQAYLPDTKMRDIALSAVSTVRESHDAD
ncbi:DUF2156 domain-containing protein [Actinomycetaceae bacterium MB13-C1-2]|nr:DUF2156 domain-containing protein [Actinomycetaceae bacterium MB13-C1-2]